MKTLFAVALVTAVIALAPVAASAQDRPADAAMGAASGLLVAGPVGAVAGGVIGYSEGPNIAHGMGLHRRHVHHYGYYYDNDGHRHYSNR